MSNKLANKNCIHFINLSTFYYLHKIINSFDRMIAWKIALALRVIYWEKILEKYVSKIWSIIFIVIQISVLLRSYVCFGEWNFTIMWYIAPSYGKWAKFGELCAKMVKIFNFIGFIQMVVISKWPISSDKSSCIQSNWWHNGRTVTPACSTVLLANQAVAEVPQSIIGHGFIYFL